MLVARLLLHVEQSPLTFATLQIAPVDELVVALDPETDTLQIGMGKSMYMALFAEGHHFLAARGWHAPDENDDIERLFLATLAVLATTNEHLTAWRLHEQVVREYQKLPVAQALPQGAVRDKTPHKPRGATTTDAAARSLVFCTMLATSRLPRVNKSPLLWAWLRKLVAARLVSPASFLRFFRHVLRSMELHPANYHAAFTAHWWLTAARTTRIDAAPALALLRAHCRANWRDLSAWAAFAQALSPPPPHIVRLYRRTRAAAVHLRPRDGDFVPTPDPDSSIADDPVTVEHSSSSLDPDVIADLQWLAAAQCAVPTPYCTLGAVAPDAARVLFRTAMASAPPAVRAALERALSVV